MTERRRTTSQTQRSLIQAQSHTIWAPASAGVSGRERDLTINPPHPPHRPPSPVGRGPMSPPPPRGGGLREG